MDAHLLHRCTVQRATVTADPYGNDVRNWADWLTDVHCRLVIRSQRAADSSLAQEPVVSEYRLFLPPHTDVREGDRIADLTLEDGSAVAETFSVEMILPRRSRTMRHITLQLERVS